MYARIRTHPYASVRLLVTHSPSLLYIYALLTVRRGCQVLKIESAEAMGEDGACANGLSAVRRRRQPAEMKLGRATGLRRSGDIASIDPSHPI